MPKNAFSYFIINIHASKLTILPYTITSVVIPGQMFKLSFLIIKVGVLLKSNGTRESVPVEFILSVWVPYISKNQIYGGSPSK